MTVADCRLTFEVPDGQSHAPLYDFLYADPSAGPVRDGSGFTIRVAAREPMPAPVAPGWSVRGSGDLLVGDGFDVCFNRGGAEAAFDAGRRGADRQAAQAAALGALRRLGCADLHAGAVVAPGTSDALVLIGASGQGKSTLTLCAAAAGWGFLSDDVIVAFAKEEEILIAPFRRRLQISEAAISLLPEAARSSPWTASLPRKLVVDPESQGIPGRRSRARPCRLVFLERGSSRDIHPISAAQAFERLLLLSPHLALDPGGRAALGLVSRLAQRIPARVAYLPLDALSDASTLDELLS